MNALYYAHGYKSIRNVILVRLECILLIPMKRDLTISTEMNEFEMKMKKKK